MPRRIITTALRVCASVACAGLLLLVVFLFGIGYPASGGGEGSPNYGLNYGLPLTFAYYHTVQVAPDTYTTPFVVNPLNLVIDFIIWSIPWYFFFGLFKLAKDH